MTNQQLYFAIGIPVLVYLFGFTITIFMMWSSNKRMDELSKRIDDLRDSFTKLLSSEIGGLREFIRSEIRRLEERIQRLETPIVRGNK